jgi:PAS domain S-box-containing protein
MAQSTIRDFVEFSTSQPSQRAWNFGSAAASLAAIVVAIVALGMWTADLSRGILFLSIALLVVVAAFHVRFLFFAREYSRRSRQLFFSKEREFQSLFENALDAILVFDDTGVCQAANPSSSVLLSARPERIVGEPLRLFYSDARDFDSLWNGLGSTYRQQGEVELARADGATVFVEFTTAAHFLPGRHLMILRDITERRRAQQAVSQSLMVTRSWWQEAETLRRATLALTEDLRMDRVLDTLLETLARFVPYQQAQLILCEDDSRLFLARETKRDCPTKDGLGFPETLELSDFPLLQRLLALQDGLLVQDTKYEWEWSSLDKGSTAPASVRSWLGVPILSSGRVLGVLSLAHANPGQFSRDHLRLVRSLATPAAVAIQNARLYERAEIYGAELERTVAELGQFKRAEH